MHEWYQIDSVEQIDSPALVVYPERIFTNIELAKQIAGNVNRLRPHVKTNKMEEVCLIMLRAGISKFKCATIAEAEMLALTGSPDILLAYQPVGPKIDRLLQLITHYPESRFSCLVDDPGQAGAIHRRCQEEGVVLDVYIDLNTGMNRTGIHPSQAAGLAKDLLSLPNLHPVGLHGYDGHIHASDPAQRQKEADRAYAMVESVSEEIQPLFSYPLQKVVGGTPTFPIHARRTDCECSPGTFIFWDYGYKRQYPDMPFEYAALVICRVISIVDSQHVCVDLGHKSVAAENPLPRVHFLNLPEAIPVAQNEEHLVLEVPTGTGCFIGQVLYGVPVHICPTVALYEKAWVIKDGQPAGSWNTVARDRYIHF